MIDIITYVVLPSIAVGLLYLVVVAAGAWVVDRCFGYQSKAYRDRFGSKDFPAARPPPTTEDLPIAVRGTGAGNLTEKAASVSALAYGLRAPLTTIIGFSDLLRQQNTIQLAPSEVVEYASQIHAAAGQILGQVDALGSDQAELQSSQNDLKRAQRR